MKIYHVLILSLMVHIALFMLARLLPADFAKTPQKQEIEVVYQNETKQKAREQGDIYTDYSDEDENPIDLLKKKVQRLSRITRRVQKEMQAHNDNVSKNNGSRKLNPLQKMATQDLLQEADKNKSKFEDFNGDGPSINKPMPDQVVRNTQLGDSSISNYIPDVRMGAFSSLNSDQFVFYTFYARTNEQIRSRWIDNIRTFINNTPQTEINRLASKAQTSQLEVILSADGHFVKALVHRKSENVALDQSAVSTFRLVSPLNNPPAEMVEADGFIHLHYVFTIYFRPSYIASGSR